MTVSIMTTHHGPSPGVPGTSGPREGQDICVCLQDPQFLGCWWPACQVSQHTWCQGTGQELQSPCGRHRDWNFHSCVTDSIIGPDTKKYFRPLYREEIGWFTLPTSPDIFRKRHYRIFWKALLHCTKSLTGVKHTSLECKLWNAYKHPSKVSCPKGWLSA